MRLAPITAALALLVAGLAQAGTVQVSYASPERFADAGHGAQAQTVRDTLTQQFERLGQRWLPATQTLRVTVTDIDLAGTAEPGRTADDLRVLKGGADWPRIALHYTLLEGERVLADGDEALAELDYLAHPAPPGATQALPYETRLLERWFRERFAAGRAP